MRRFNAGGPAQFHNIGPFHADQDREWFNLHYSQILPRPYLFPCPSAKITAIDE